MPEYRIEYSIQRKESDDNFTEIGFGQSGEHDDVDAALNAIESDIQNRQWETTPDMPDPDSVDVGAP